MDVVILSGQSNMAGRGGVHDGVWDGLMPAECVSNREAVSVQRLSALLEWEDAKEPLHWDIDTSKPCGVGPGMAFAASVADSSSGMRLGLVPCAVGGTALEQWERGKELYSTMIRRGQAAAQGGRNRIKAMLWYQGESDTLLPEAVPLFRSRLETLIADVRADLGVPDLPVIQVGITVVSHPFPALLEQVREAQRAVNSLPGVYYVDALGLPLKADGVHLTTGAQVQLGQMLAAVYNDKCSSRE